MRRNRKRKRGYKANKEESFENGKYNGSSQYAVSQCLSLCSCASLCGVLVCKVICGWGYLGLCVVMCRSVWECESVCTDV